MHATVENIISGTIVPNNEWIDQNAGEMANVVAIFGEAKDSATKEQREQLAEAFLNQGDEAFLRLIFALPASAAADIKAMTKVNAHMRSILADKHEFATQMQEKYNPKK